MSVNAALEKYNITQAELDQILTGLNSISRSLNLTLESIVQVSVSSGLTQQPSYKRFHDPRAFLLLGLFLSIWPDSWPRFTTEEKRNQARKKIGLKFESAKSKATKEFCKRLLAVPDSELSQFIWEYGIAVEVSPSDREWKKFCIDAIAKSVIKVLEGSSKLPKQDGTPFDFFGHGNGDFGVALALVREDIRYPESTKNKIGV